MNTAILLATYNGQQFLAEQIDSLLGQTVSDFTIYIHDDGSTDGTAELLEKLAKKHAGRIVLVDGKPCGSAKENFWYLLSKVEADTYFFCDQDDVWLPKKVEKSLQKLQSLHGACRCVFTDMRVVDGDLHEIDGSFLHYNGRDPYEQRYPRILIDNPAAGTAMCFDRALRDLALSVRFDLSDVEMHDGFLLAMASLCGTTAYIDEPLVLYRQHGANDMGAARAETVLQRIQRNLSDLVTGRFVANKKEFLSLSRNAARELSRLPAAASRDKKILKTYANLEKLPKWKRIRFMKKYGFDRARHTWWMYLLS